MADAQDNTTIVNQDKPVDAGAPADKVTEKPNTEQPKDAPVVPEKYDLKIPEGSPLDNSAVERISTLAKEKGLSNEHAQLLLENESKALSSYVDGQEKQLTKTLNEWMEQVKSDPEIGGTSFDANLQLAKDVVNRFGTDKFKEQLEKSRLGNHPELIRMFVKIGKAMGSDSLVTPGAQSPDKKALSDMFYGSSK